MTRLQVEIRDFVNAANICLDDISEPVRAATGRLTLTLADCAGMAGDDEGGRSWATGYDQAARAVTTATTALTAGARQTAHLFGQSANNYATAEHAATPGNTTPDWPAYSMSNTTTPAAPNPPTAAGGDGGGGEPTGWGLVKHLVGYVWPNGHQDKLHRAADAYRHCADTLDTAADKPILASIPFTVDHLPEADDIATVCRILSAHTRDLAAAHHSLADTCEQLAHHLDQCHSAVEAELIDLAAESAAIQVGGAVLAVLTAGAAEAPTQAVQAARISAVAARIGALIRRFTTAAKLLDTATLRVNNIAHTITHALDQLANARIAVATATHAPGLTHMAAAGKDAAKAGSVGKNASKEAEAVAHLEEEAKTSKLGRDLISEKDQKHILDGDGKGGGGHRYPGAPGKSSFPEGWTDDQILDNVGDIVTSPATIWRLQDGSAGAVVAGDSTTVWRAWEVRDGVRMRIAYEPGTGRVRSAFPDAGPAKGAIIQ